MFYLIYDTSLSAFFKKSTTFSVVLGLFRQLDLFNPTKGTDTQNEEQRLQFIPIRYKHRSKQQNCWGKNLNQRCDNQQPIL